MTGRTMAGRCALVALTAVSSAGAEAVQAQAARGANPNAPKLMVSACRTDDKALAVLCADKVRSQIEGDISYRSIYVRTKDDVENALRQSGYDPAVALGPGDATALAKTISADLYVDVTVSKTAAGLKATAAAIPQRDANLVQPLGTFEGARIEAVAQQISKSFSDVFDKTWERQKNCFTFVRERRYPEAQKAIDDGLKANPNSTWMRYCQLNLAKDQRAGADAIIKVAEAIRQFDPMSRTVLSELVPRYDAAGNKEKKLAALQDLQKADPTNSSLQAQIANDIAAMGDFEKALPIVQKAVADNPGDLNLIRTYWNVLIALNRTKEAIQVGDEMVKLDTAAADSAYYSRSWRMAGQIADTAKAISLLHAAGAKFPKVVEFPRTESALLRATGKTAESVAAAKRALAANPNERGMRASLVLGLLGESPPNFDGAMAMVKEMQAAKEDSATVAGSAVSIGNRMRTSLAADSVRAKGGDAEAVKAASHKVYATTAWADSLAKGTPTAAQGNFVMGVAAMSLGQIYLTEAGDIGRKLSDDIKAQKPDAAKQRAMMAEAYPRACALTNKANEYMTVASGAVPQGGRFAPDAARQAMGAIQQMNPYIEQMTKAYCKAP
ncbi:MAG: tetratricopeptide repeat protein [Gemmatimonadetes bacterium]|nr:tetratricopeptide repeat protein [Gemmatimonadota bacterium]